MSYPSPYPLSHTPPPTFWQACGMAGMSLSPSSVYSSGGRPGRRGLWGCQTPSTASPAGSKWRVRSLRKNNLQGTGLTRQEPPSPPPLPLTPSTSGIWRHPQPHYISWGTEGLPRLHRVIPSRGVHGIPGLIYHSKLPPIRPENPDLHGAYPLFQKDFKTPVPVQGVIYTLYNMGGWNCGGSSYLWS